MEVWWREFSVRKLVVHGCLGVVVKEDEEEKVRVNGNTEMDDFGKKAVVDENIC